MTYRVPNDDTVAEVVQRVLGRHGNLPSQMRLGELVRRSLLRRDERFRVSDERVRRVALVRGLARVRLTTGTTDRPAPEQCPACGAALTLVRNRTFDGGETIVGTTCRACPYRSGPSYEVPLRYEFVPTRAKGARKGPF